MIVKIRPIAIANHIHRDPRGAGSSVGYYHTLDRIREAFGPENIGFIEDDVLRSFDEIWMCCDVPTTCYSVLS